MQGKGRGVRAIIYHNKDGTDQFLVYERRHMVVFELRNLDDHNRSTAWSLDYHSAVDIKEFLEEFIEQESGGR